MSEIHRAVDLFAGIGGIRIAFEQTGRVRTVFSSDWDDDARDVYEENFGERPFGDINDIDPADVPDHDILLAGFPCQPFSVAGLGRGFADTRGTAFFRIEEILREKRPAAFMLENVRRLVTHDNKRTISVILSTLDRMGYAVYHEVLNALDFGLPQKRERVFIVGFREPIHFSFPPPIGGVPRLADVLEPDDEVDPSCFISDEAAEEKKRAAEGKMPSYFPSVWHTNLSNIVTPHPYSCALCAHEHADALLVNGKRLLTVRERLRLQGFPADYEIDKPYTTARRLVGNSVPVPVVAAIAGQMLLAMDEGRRSLALM